MRKMIFGMSALALAAMATPALAQDEASDGFTLSGGAAIVSDYRFRGVSQNGEEAAIQGYATLTHESGFYVGFWGSSINFDTADSLGNPTNQTTEIDAIAGYSMEVAPGITVDGGVTYYLYPGGTDLATDIIEPFLSVSGDIGPVSAKVGVAYSPTGQNSLGNDDSVYLYGDLSAAIPNTPVTLNGHWGYTDGSLGGYTGNYADYSFGATASWKALTFGVSYVNTSGYGNKPFKESAGADGTVVFSVSAGF